MVLLTVVVILDFTTKAVLEGMNTLISPGRPIPRNLVQITKVMFRNESCFEERLLNFLFNSAHIFVFLRATEINPIIAHDHSHTSLVVC